MSKSSTLPGKATKIYAAIQDAAVLLTEGVVLACDPSIGSASSMPGWACYESGTLVDSGTLDIDASAERWDRLKQVYRLLRNMSRMYKVDACVYEDIPVSAHSGRSQVGHASLLMAVGVTMAAIDARKFIGIPPVTWKRLVGPDYVKGDAEDAREMGRIVIAMAQEIRELDPPRRYK